MRQHRVVRATDAETFSQYLDIVVGEGWAFIGYSTTRLDDDHALFSALLWRETAQ